MEMEKSELQNYLSKSIQGLVKDIIKTNQGNFKELFYLLSYFRETKQSTKIRQSFESKGEHIPPFLICSITSSCNLHCQGCYARANDSCNDRKPVNQLTAEQWDRIFAEAETLGIGFILLAGGEPLYRKDVIEKAAQHKRILFPVFTNGTLIDNNFIELIQKNRNIVPVFSLEGTKEETDLRRGNGMHEHLLKTMELLKKKGAIFGASITVTTANINDVYSEQFAKDLSARGGKATIYVEYVPTTNNSANLALKDVDRAFAESRIKTLRKTGQQIFLSFPDDEKALGGCLAAGRGFFHINSHGEAEPCPFSPFKAGDVAKTSIREALQSPLFSALAEKGLLNKKHEGGCVLFKEKDEINKIVEAKDFLQNKIS